MTDDRYERLSRLYHRDQERSEAVIEKLQRAIIEAREAVAAGDLEAFQRVTAAALQLPHLS